jgi:hypothetical protein
VKSIFGYVDPAILRDPREYLSQQYGVTPSVLKPVRQPTLGQARDSTAKHLVNGVWAVVATVGEAMYSLHLRLFYRNGRLVAEQVPTPSQESDFRRATNVVRDYLITLLLGKVTDGKRVSDGRFHTVFRENGDLAETATVLFGPLQTLGVIDDATEFLQELLDSQFEDGDPYGDIRANSSGTDSRAYRQTVAVNEAAGRVGYWPIGDGKSQPNEGPFGLQRLVWFLVGEVGEETVRETPDGEAPDFVLPTQTIKVDDEELVVPVPRDDAPDGVRAFLVARAARRLSPGYIRRQPVDEKLEAAVVDYAVLVGYPLVLEERYHESGSDLPFEQWLEWRPRSNATEEAESPSDFSDMLLKGGLAI